MSASNETRTLTASAASASGSLPFTRCGSRDGTDSTPEEESLSLPEPEAASVTRDSVSAGEMPRLSRTPESASPLVYHRGALAQVLSQEKALVPVSRASTARME